MPRPPSPVKRIMARLELERLARRPPPVTDRERRWVTAPMTRAWAQWEASPERDTTALRALYRGYSRTFARWQQLQGTRRGVPPGEDPTLYALLPRYPEPCRALRCGLGRGVARRVSVSTSTALDAVRCMEGSRPVHGRRRGRRGVPATATVPSEPHAR
jgi:hypothetical protein